MNNFIAARGADAVGLVRYLFGPGDRDEHRDQRVIAADDPLDVPDGTRLADPADWPRVLELGRALEAPRRLWETEVPGGHVWHCAISLPRGEPDEPGGEDGEALTDDQWAMVARAAVEALGFTENCERGRAACRWIAVHHGPSARGCDHVHLAVSLAREDGTIASTWMDRRTMSQVCGRFEREFGLYVVPGRAGRGMPGYSRAEADRVRRGRRIEPDRHTLARQVRGCAQLARTEAQFVHAVRAAGLSIRPRYAAAGKGAGKGSGDRVVGYSVALPPAAPALADVGESGRQVWYGGGKLAADLSLPRLREHWPGPRRDRDPDRRHADDLAAWAGRPGHAPGQRAAEHAPAGYPDQVWRRGAERLAGLYRRLIAVPVGDTAAWASTARHAAGVLAVLSTRLEDRPGPLAEAADALARCAQTPPGAPRLSRDHGLADMRGLALLAASARHTTHAAGGRQDGRGWPDPWLQVLRQLLILTAVLERAHRARQELAHAQQLEHITSGRLAALTGLDHATIHAAVNAIAREARQARTAAELAADAFPHPPPRHRPSRRPDPPGQRPGRRPPRPPGPDRGHGLGR